MTPADVLARARGAIGQGCAYGLGHGGMDPTHATPWGSDGACDCSGFVSWCLGVSRHCPDNPWYKAVNGGWFETSAIVRDARSPYGVFDAVAWVAARPADLLVWGDRDGHQGHVGLVAAVDAQGAARVIHCSLGNYHATGDAIRETDASLFFRNGATVARCAWVTP